MSPSPDLRVERLLRDLAPHVLGATVRRFRDFAGAIGIARNLSLLLLGLWCMLAHSFHGLLSYSFMRWLMAICTAPPEPKSIRE